MSHHSAYVSHFCWTAIPLMNSEGSWEWSYVGYHFHDTVNHQTFLPIDQIEDQSKLVSLNSSLPDDLLEKVLYFLPISSLIRSGSVCKRWYDIVHCRRHAWSNMIPQKPWYFMFTCSESASGYVYDPSIRKWYSFELPCMENRNWLFSSSCGLVCYMDSDRRSRIFVCNPITGDSHRLQDAPGGVSAYYSALAISVDRGSHSYTVVVVRATQVPEDFLLWDFAVHLYESETKSWITPVKEILCGWRGSTESVICSGRLYCLIYSTSMLGITDPRFGVIVYNLSARLSTKPMEGTVIQIPYSLTCVRLMNLQDRLIMVGGIGKQDRANVIKGIGIWELRKEGWQEFARMPPRFFPGFGEFDEVFASNGGDDLIYIQCYGSTALLIFDMSKKVWKWSLKCPVTKKFPLQLFTGFCFEPRLEVVP